MDGLVVPMMRAWSYRESFNAALRSVWVADVEFPTLVNAGLSQEGFNVLETVVVSVNVPLRFVVGVSHFVDERNRIWFVNEVALSTVGVGARTEVSLSRYGLAAGLGYDVPSERASRFGPPTGWTLTDAAGVPVQVVRVSEVYYTYFNQPNVIPLYVRFRLNTVAGDTGSQAEANAVPASQRQRGGRRRDGWLVRLNAGGSLFVFEDGNPYASRGVKVGIGPNDDIRPRPELAGKVLSQDADVAVGDFFVITGSS